MNTYSLQEQLQEFIINPMKEVDLISTVVVVIDALDEIGVENEREEISQAIAKVLPDLPNLVKVFLTSKAPI